MDYVLYIPGLHDMAFPNKQLTATFPLFWEPFGVKVHIVRLRWSKGKSFAPKLKVITDLIDTLATKKNKVFLVGQSAGASAVLNAYVARKKKVAGVVSIDGRLRDGNVFPSLRLLSVGNPAFKESVLLFEHKNEKKLTKEDRKKILTLHPIWDDIVPVKTATLNEVKDITMPIFTHKLGGVMACAIYAKTITNFLKKIEIKE
ncbi:MAG: hypothetical protein ACREGI_02255 [Candidatus Levyibacteriota bacterium]